MNFGFFQLAFSNPALWVGAFGIGVPVLIHLLTRRTPRNLIFPTIQFIVKAQASQSAIFRIRHLLMLLIRTLIILFILLAFVKPLLHSGLPPSPGNKKTQKTTIVLLDVSASMGYTGAGVTPLSRAKAAAQKIVAQMRAGDLVNLLLVANSPKASFDAPSDNRFHIRRDIESARVTEENGNIDAAVSEALRQLATAPGAKKELICLSDFQRSNWASVNFSAIPKSVQTIFIPVGEERTDNLAITEVMIQPPTPTVAEGVEIICKVANYGTEARRVPLELQFRDEKALLSEIFVDPGMTVSTSFRIRANKSGLYEAVLRLPDDGLPVDNQRFLSFNVEEQIQILLLSDKDPEDTADAHHFIQRAINPFLDAQRGAAVSTLMRSDQLDAFALVKSQIVIASGIRELSKKNAGLLMDYVRNGGGLIYFISGQADVFNLKLLAELSNGDFIPPFQLGGPVDRGQSEPASLGQANFDHPLLRKFKETGDLGNPRFYRYFTTVRTPQQGRVFLKYDDDNIAMAEKTVNLGAILLCNFSFSLTHSDFPKHTLFVPFVHEMIQSQRPVLSALRNFEVGFPCSTTIPIEKKTEMFEFQNPDGEPIDASLEMAETEAAVFFPRTDKTGFYRILKDDETRGAVAVNLNPLESNLQALSVEQLQELSQLSRDKFFAATGSDLASLQHLLGGRPIWHYLLLTALCFLAVEQMLILFWKK